MAPPYREDFGGRVADGIAAICGSRPMDGEGGYETPALPLGCDDRAEGIYLLKTSGC